MTRGPQYWLTETAAKILLVQLVLTGALLPLILARRSRFRRSVGLQQAMAAAVCTMVLPPRSSFVLAFKH